MIKYLLSFALVVSTTASYAAPPRSDVNFAFGGATTNSQNATALFAPELDGAARAAGLELIGLTQQLDFAEATIGNVSATDDVFWLWAGTNNILIGSIIGAPDPTLAPKELKAAMVRLYTRLGARNFVVPNLMLLGNIPQFNSDAATQAGVNALTAQQNALLAQAIAEFSSEYPRANVIPLDVQTLFTELENSGEFANTSEACFTTGLPNGLPCSGYLYADDIHFSSAAATRIAERALSQLEGLNVRRIITVGDSFVDTGSFYNTIERATGMGFPAAPFFEGRFSDGPGVIDQLESMLLPEVTSHAFEQPIRKTISEGSNDLETTFRVLVPANINMTNESRFGLVFLSFGNKGYCWSFPDGKVDGYRRISGCTGSLRKGKNISVESVSLIAPFTPGDATTDIYYYNYDI